MIETWNLEKTFPPTPRWLSLTGRRLAHPVHALRPVTLQIAPGEIFGLLGPNGAGKTTFLKILATLLLPTRGRAHLYGHDVVREAGAVRMTVGVAPGQERGFYWRLTGRENLEFFAGMLGLGPRDAGRRIGAALETVDLGDAANELVERYSTGMRQRLGLARALLGEPRVLLLDEPTKSLDMEATGAVHAAFRRLARERGQTILLATHQLPEAAGLCDRAAILIRGSVRDIVPARAMGESLLAERYRSSLAGADDTPVPAVGLS
jgi:ABC-2 type transport system ATP-binding protein